jgi:hypothetical protein
VSTVVRLRGPLSAAQIGQACDEVSQLLRRQGRVMLVVADCDLSVVDAVSRIRLLARRHAAPLEVVGADEALFQACGLADVL